MEISNFKDLLWDWIKAYSQYYSADPITENDLKSFKETIYVRATLAKNYLDTTKDGRVEWEDFRNISDGEFWELIDYQADVDENDEQYTQTYTLEQSVLNLLPPDSDES